MCLLHIRPRIKPYKDLNDVMDRPLTSSHPTSDRLRNEFNIPWMHIAHTDTQAYKTHNTNSIFTASQNYVFNVHQIATSGWKINIFRATARTNIPLRIQQNTSFQVKISTFTGRAQPNQPLQPIRQSTRNVARNVTEFLSPVGDSVIQVNCNCNWNGKITEKYDLLNFNYN